MMIQIGNFHVRLLTYTPQARATVRQFLDAFPYLIGDQSTESDWSLMIVTPHLMDEERISSEYADNYLVHKRIHKSWAMACQAKLKNSDTNIAQNSLDKFWKAVSLGYQSLWYNCEDPGEFIYFVSDEIDSSICERLFSAIIFMATWWHVQHGGCRLHGAAVARNARNSYLFLGRSGAGKSTLSDLSASIGRQVLQDDTVFLRAEQNNEYVLMAAPRIDPDPPKNAHLSPALRGIFTLIQDERNYIVPLSQRATAAALYDGFQSLSTGQRLPGKVVTRAFQNSCEVARKIPGYELHFCKTPDFWKLIDGELPD